MRRVHRGGHGDRVAAGPAESFGEAPVRARHHTTPRTQALLPIARPAGAPPRRGAWVFEQVSGFVRTVSVASVAVRVMCCAGVRVHGRIAASVGATNPIRWRLSRSGLYGVVRTRTL